MSLEIVLVKCNLLNNQYQQNSGVLNTFMLKKSFAHMLNVEPNNLVFFKSCNNEVKEKKLLDYV